MLFNSSRSYESDELRQYGSKMIKDEKIDYSDDEDKRLDVEEDDCPRKDKLMEGKFKTYDVLQFLSGYKRVKLSKNSKISFSLETLWKLVSTAPCNLHWMFKEGFETWKSLNCYFFKDNLKPVL